MKFQKGPVMSVSQQNGINKLSATIYKILDQAGI